MRKRAGSSATVARCAAGLSAPAPSPCSRLGERHRPSSPLGRRRLSEPGPRARRRPGRRRRHADELRSVGARDQRPRLRARHGTEPMGRVRVRAARLDVRRKSSRTTTRARRSVPSGVTSVRVLVSLRRKAVLSSAAPWSVRGANGETVALASGRLTLGPKLAVATGKQPALVAPLTFASAQPISVGGVPYRGRFVVSAVGNEGAGRQRRLARVLPRRCRPGGDARNLAGRRARGPGRRVALLRAREPDREPRLRPLRRHAQPGLRRHPRRVAGGERRRRGDEGSGRALRAARSPTPSTSPPPAVVRHRAAEATGTAVPYLVSVADPYDAISPDHDWGPVLVPASRFAKALKLAGPLEDLETTTGPSGRVVSATAVSGGEDAGERDRRAAPRRPRAALHVVHGGALAARSRVLAAVTYGGAVSLTGFARHATGVSLESKTASGGWIAAGLPDARRGRKLRRDREAARPRRSTGSPGERFAPGSPRSLSPLASLPP